VLFLHAPVQYTGERAREREEDLLRKNHSLNELVRYYKKQLGARLALDRQTQIHLYRQQYTDIGKLLYLWQVAETRQLTDHERVYLAGKILHRVSGGHDGMGTLVRDINRQFGNVLVHLQDDFPDLKPEDFKLFCYLAVGFDNDLMAELLGLSGKDPLYTRKTRLKKRLEESRSPYRDLYLDLIKE